MFDFERTGGIKEFFVWSDLDSPTQLRNRWLPPFEAAMKTIRVALSGPINDEWFLKFTDLARAIISEVGYLVH